MEDILESLLGTLRKSQRTVITLVVEALASLRQAASIPIAMVLAQLTQCLVPSALTRFYRCLHNPRIDDTGITLRMWSLSASLSRSALCQKVLDCLRPFPFS